ncbi:helix-turn-helix transcriptional regulator [Dysgonomonas sp. Marseille-Q5470]|uniref:helix-turn-helix domain-containing protein n=1 Tax=Dysgonomonas TaxID=156973 RepID=UPI0024BCC9BF|nr:helix-turn-helix transcriptional regulator [Dysgonomonas sp. Marseille-Q5470]
MGLRIKEILKEKRMQVAELAVLIEITPQNLSKLINEKTKPSIDTYERIAVALGVPFTDLFEQPKQNVITCPHCNGRIKVEKE